MKAAERISDFTTARARQRFDPAYRALLTRLWPEPPVPSTVATSYGDAVAYRTGRPDGIPVVLVPGAGGSAVTWYQYAERLGRRHPVIALDPIGEPGMARQSRPIGTAHDAAAVLAETLAGLGVPRCHLIGMSYGGWTLLHHELAFPGRAASLTLLDPGGLGRIGARFWVWLIAGGLAGLTPRPVRHRLAGPVRNATLRADELMPLLPLTMRFRRRLPMPDVLTDEQLGRITTPTLVLLGERSVLYRTGEVAERLGRVMPGARVEVVPGASHDLPVHSPGLVADRVEAFLDAHPSSGSRAIG
ncbi:alpha/beta hydrolase [Paractinoplanes ferrugineus]|uniref:AB hydrolase-1 domain-containing protein n=1 Tax=Paractinoplanes ferrugineus TaxID=113564 RepID=A0A919J3H7_9ACTN|nr:alpha/beta hydrolase [Actinoplanes ferrugineus]GIE12682.1 hypothetical protein Afe05nite_45220 [Actinoplanes ferrugineus]